MRRTLSPSLSLPLAGLVLLTACSSTDDKPDAPVTAEEEASEPVAEDTTDETDAAAPATAAAVDTPPAFEAAELPGEDHPMFVGYSLFNDGELDEAAAMFAEDATWRSTFREAPFEGREQIAGALKAWTPLSPAVGAKRVFRMKAGDGEVMIVEGVIAGKHSAEYEGKAPTGKKFAMPYAHVAWFNGANKIERYLAVFNGMALPSQLGFIDAPATPMATMPLADTELVVGEGAAAPGALVKALTAGDMNAIGESLHDDVVAHHHHTGETVTGKAAVLEAEAAMGKALADRESSQMNLAAVGDYVVVFGVERATLVGDLGPIKATGGPVQMSQVSVFRFEGDKVVELNVYMDPVEMLRPAAAAN